MANKPRLRERQSRETRERILACARELLVSEGMDQFSMRKLAARVGCTATAIYFHFPDKDALLTELVDTQFLAFRRTFDRFQAVADPITRLSRMGAAYVDFALRHPDHYRFLFLTSSVNELPRGAAIQRGNPAQDAYAHLRGTVSEAIANGCFRPDYQDADQLAQIIWAALHGLVTLHIVRGADPWIAWSAPRPSARLLVDALLRGLTRNDV